MLKIKSPTEFNSLLELVLYFKDERTCLDFVEQMRWDGQPTCIYCESPKVYRFKNGKILKCATCRKQFTVLVDTVFESTKLPLLKWFMAIYFVANDKKGISSYQLARNIGITQSRAWHMLQKIRSLLNQNEVELSGIIESDETFVGGKNKNRHKDKKIKNSQGRSFKDKTPVLGLLETEIYCIIHRPHKVIPGRIVREKKIVKEGKLLCSTVADTTSESIQPIILKYVEKNSTLVSDEWSGYAGIGNNYHHEIVFHNKGQFVSSNGYSTNGIEGHWSHFKKTIMGTHHRVSKKHLGKYADESAFRYNTKNKTDAVRFNLIMSKITNYGKRQQDQNNK